MPDFSKRSKAPEIMDDFSLGHDQLDPVLKELKVINALLGGFNVFYDAFRKLGTDKVETVSDWGCGGGDTLLRLHRWALKMGLVWQLSGIDATEATVDFARKLCKEYPNLSFIHADVLKDKMPMADVVISGLFTHHFEDKDWVRLVRSMYDHSRHGVVINDLHRHPVAYYAISVLTAIFSRSAMVRHDAGVSVLRGFTRKELVQLLQQAGIRTYRIKWMWAFRWQVVLFK